MVIGLSRNCHSSTKGDEDTRLAMTASGQERVPNDLPSATIFYSTPNSKPGLQRQLRVELFKDVVEKSAFFYGVNTSVYRCLS